MPSSPPDAPDGPAGCGNHREGRASAATTEEEWAFAAPYLTLLPEDAGQRRHDLRAGYDATRWMVRAGAAWRPLPGDFPPRHAAYDQARRWPATGRFEAMAHDLRAVLRLAGGRAAGPSAATIGSRTLRSTPGGGARAGRDGAERQKGSKQHAAVDALGRPLAPHVTPAERPSSAWSATPPRPADAASREEFAAVVGGHAETAGFGVGHPSSPAGPHVGAGGATAGRGRARPPVLSGMAGERCDARQA